MRVDALFVQDVCSIKRLNVRVVECEMRERYRCSSAAEQCGVRVREDKERQNSSERNMRTTSAQR